MPMGDHAKIKKYKTDQKENGAEIEFDPCAMLDAEFEEDAKKQKAVIEKVYGRSKVARKDQESQLTKNSSDSVAPVPYIYASTWLGHSTPDETSAGQGILGVQEVVDIQKIRDQQ